MTTVRMATPADFDGVMHLGRLLHAENGQHAWDDAKAQEIAAKLLECDGGYIGVIGAPDNLHGMIGIQLDQPWYSSAWMLVELFNFVHPAHRRSTHAKSLIGHAKGYADQLGIPLVIGIISNHRTEAKVRLYRRMLPKAGEFFTYRPGDVASHRSPRVGAARII